MKRILTILLTLVLSVGLCACGDSNTPPEVTEAAELAVPTETEATQSPAAEEVVYKLGDVIETELFKITPYFTGYAKELANWPDENFMTPAGKFSGSSPYNADEEKTAIYGEVQIEYIGNEKTDVSLNIDISVNYDDGYIFEGADVDMGNCVSVDGDWQYDGEMTFEPLSSSITRILRYCVQVPEQVEANTDKSLQVTFLVNGEAYIYDFRSGEVLGSDYDPRGEFYQPIDEETKSQIVSYLKEKGLAEVGWYDTTVGVYTFTFGDTDVSAVLPINNSYQYDFIGTYEIYSGTILITWDYGQQMHLDYTFDGITLEIIDFAHDR